MRSETALRRNGGFQEPMLADSKVRGSLRTRRTDALLRLVTLIIVTYVWRVQDMIQPLATIKFPTLIGLVALALFAVDKRPIRRFRLVNSWILRLLFVLTLIIAVGVPFSILPGYSFDFLTKDFVPDVLMVLVVAASVRVVSDLDRLLAAHLLGSVIYCLYALLFFGTDGTGRLGGLLYYDANDLAQTIVCTLPVAFYFLRSGSPRWQRVLALGAVPILLVNFIRAGSRGGFLGLIAVAAATTLAYRPIRARTRYTALVVILGGMFIVGGEEFSKKMESIMSPDDDYNMQSETGRWQLWKNGLSLVRQRPIFGVGARRFPEANATLSDLARERIELDQGLIPWQPAHNSYVSIAAETGVAGFLVFASLLLTSLFTALRFSRITEPSSSGRDLAAISRTLAISLLGYMVSAFFLTAEYQAVLYLNIGLLLGARKLTNKLRSDTGAVARVATTTRPRTRASLGGATGWTHAAIRR
jgi:O-Antigen ligase